MKAVVEPFCSKLHLQNGIISLFYSSHVTPMHRHNALQLVFDLKNEFLFRTDLTGWVKYKCLFIKAGVNHQLATNNSLQLILYLDEFNPMAVEISKKYLVNKNVYEPDLSISLTEEIMVHRILFNHDTASSVAFIKSFLDRLIKVEEEYSSDSRIRSILQLVKETPAADLSIDYLSNKICISSSRLRAHFKNRIGLPLHQYILRYKVLNAINEIANGSTIRDAVNYSGFNDSSHFNKILKKIFMIKPSQFLKENSYNSESNKTKFIFETELT